MNNLIITIRSNNVVSLWVALLMGLTFRNIYGIAKHFIFAWTKHLDFGSSPHPTPESQYFVLTVAFNLAIDFASSLIAAAFCGSLLVYVFQVKARVLCLVSVVVFWVLSSRLWRFWTYPELGMQISSLMGPILAGLVFVSVVWLIVKLRAA